VFVFVSVSRSGSKVPTALRDTVRADDFSVSLNMVVSICKEFRCRVVFCVGFGIKIRIRYPGGRWDFSGIPLFCPFRVTTGAFWQSANGISLLQVPSSCYHPQPVTSFVQAHGCCSGFSMVLCQRTEQTRTGRVIVTNCCMAVAGIKPLFCFCRRYCTCPRH
jgi:hypothetical protein